MDNLNDTNPFALLPSAVQSPLPPNSAALPPNSAALSPNSGALPPNSAALPSHSTSLQQRSPLPALHTALPQNPFSFQSNNKPQEKISILSMIALDDFFLLNFCLVYILEAWHAYLLFFQSLDFTLRAFSHCLTVELKNRYHY